MSREPISETAPLVTVIIPAHNEETFIDACLASINGQDWPADRIEILVIDHASTDTTAARALRAGARVITKPDGKIGSVRNAGLLAANGEFVAYVDADCTVPGTWLRNATGLLEAGTAIGAVGGPCLCPEPATWIERTFASREPQTGDKEVHALATSSFIARRALLLDIGLFNETLDSGEDDDISRRIKARHLALLSSPRCHVVHHGYPRTLCAVALKERWHGSNQLESRSAFDATLALTHLFATATLALPAVAALWIMARTEWAAAAALALLLLQLLPPAFFAAKRLSLRRSDAYLIPAWLAVGYAYFWGRSLGLIANYWSRFSAFRRAAHQASI